MSNIWPGFHCDNTQKNSSKENLEDFNVSWINKMYGQPPNPISKNDIRGSMRSKTINIRNNEICLVDEKERVLGLGFFDTNTGKRKRWINLKDQIKQTTRAEYNKSGIEGRDLREGQVFHHWHSDGKIYIRTPGDTSSRCVIHNSTEEIIDNFAESGSNQSAWFTLQENNNLCIIGRSGHTGYAPSFWMKDYLNYVLTENPDKRRGSTLVIDGKFLQWFGYAILDGDDVYILGNTGHKNFPMTDQKYPKLGMIGTCVLKAKFDREKVRFNKDWYWEKPDSFSQNESEICHAPKAFAINDNFFFVVYHTGVDILEDGIKYNYNKPTVVNFLNKETGEGLEVVTSIKADDHNFGGQVLNYVQSHTYFPELSLSDKYLALFLPKGVQTKPVDPYGTPYSTLNQCAQLSIIDLETKKEKWYFKYEKEETTPQWIHGCQNTRTIILGDYVYVVWIESSPKLKNYIDDSFKQKILRVDRFYLEDGKKESLSFNIDDGNTCMIDDLASVDGKLYILATIYEYNEKCFPRGGRQVLICLGKKIENNETEEIEDNTEDKIKDNLITKFQNAISEIQELTKDIS